MDKCVYIPIESTAPYPRQEYKCSCGFRYVLMESEVYDGLEYVERTPDGEKCMKCGKIIKVQNKIPKDKIREELFIKWASWYLKQNTLSYNDPLIWDLIQAFEAGYKSRDEEIKELKDIIYGLERNYLKKAKICGERHIEIKKLRDALEHIGEYWNGGNESAVDAIEEAEETAKEALKDGE